MNNILRIAVINAILMMGGSLAWSSTAMAQQAEVQSYRIAAGDLETALSQFGTQSRIQLLYSPELLEGKRSPGLTGSFTPTQALRQLLQGSGLEAERVNSSTVVLKKTAATPSPAKSPVQKPAPSASAPEEKVTELAEILVTGTRSLNADIERTRDDVQPYVVFHRETIERSGVSNLDEFLKQRLPMNTQATSDNQNPPLGSRSNINLRGLGVNQTLILIDGRRTSNTFRGGSLHQYDLNGIPLAAIERIEVLPTTASGIYGGDATGGVINIILRRDYQGAEVKLTYDNTFDSDVAQRRIDVSTGFNLEGGKTNVMINAYRQDSNPLLRDERDFIKRYRDQGWTNNPNLFLPPARPPLGYTPNIRSTSGDLVLDDGTPLNASFTHAPVGYAGAASDGGAALRANAGRYNLDWANTSQGGGARNALLDAPEVEAINATIRRKFTPRVEGFVELSASDNIGFYKNNSIFTTYVLPADAPNNPFQQDVQVSVPFQDYGNATRSRNTDRRFAGGLIVKLPGSWLAEVDYVWNRTSLHFANDFFDQLTPAGVAALTDGTLDILRDPNAYPLDITPYLQARIERKPYETTARHSTLLLGGPIGALPGGVAMLSTRLEHRDEQFGAGMTTYPPGHGSPEIEPSKSQTVSSVFAGLTVPLFSSLNARPGLEELELQLSVRHDRYTIGGAEDFLFSPTDPVNRVESDLSSTNFTAGFRWKPIEDVALRASYGTGFLPPSVSQLVPFAPFIVSDFFLDPRRGNTQITGFQYVFGGNPNIGPEESKSVSAGLILTPRFLPGFRFSVDYTRIKKTDNIAGLPSSVQGWLDNEAQFPDRVVRGPNLPGDPVGWAGPVVLIDDSYINLARAEVEAYDLQMDYTRDTSAWGSFNFFAIATWQTHYTTQLMEGLPVIENVGFSRSPLRFKANAGVSWTREAWTLGWTSRYFDSYLPYTAGDFPFPTLVEDALLTQGAARIESQLYHDLTGQYEFDGGGGKAAWLKGVSIQFGIRNVFNELPPRELTSYSPYGDPRLASYWIAIRKSFGN